MSANPDITNIRMKAFVASRQAWPRTGSSSNFKSKNVAIAKAAGFFAARVVILQEVSSRGVGLFVGQVGWSVDFFEASSVWIRHPVVFTIGTRR
jgi:hypothetical protein